MNCLEKIIQVQIYIKIFENLDEIDTVGKF